MKPIPPTSDRPFVWIPKFDLSVHEAVSQTPEDRTLVETLKAEWRRKLARGVKPDRLIHDNLQINAGKEIGDGRHRFLAALGIDEIHSLPCAVVDDADFEALVCEKLLQRRHYSKSALAYSLRHMAAKAAQAGRDGRATMGGYAKAKSASPIASAKQETGTLESLSEKTHLSTDLLQQAVKLERDYMSRADKLIADWLGLNPEDAASWQAWRDENPTIEMPWSCWRSQALAASGLPDDPKSVNIIPKSWREIEEDKIFNGIQEQDGEDDDRRSYSLGAALKAMGSYFATAGKDRPDLNGDSPALYLTLKNKLASFGKTMWAKWSDVDPAGRMEVIKDLAAMVPTWPEDVQRALMVALAKTGGGK
jgi:lambda repressor-like predicted transcriptional regulator